MRKIIYKILMQTHFLLKEFLVSRKNIQPTLFFHNSSLVQIIREREELPNMSEIYTNYQVSPYQLFFSFSHTEF